MKDSDLIAILRSPCCHRPLQPVGESLQCPLCLRRYPQHHGIFNLLPQDRTELC